MSKLVTNFLNDYVEYDQLTRTLEMWAREHAALVRVSSLGKTENGRDIWLLEIGRDPDRPRPTICIDANMHSAELLGTNAALCIAQDLINLHRGEGGVCDRLPRSIRESALDGLYYIIPRVTPDGVEAALTAGRISCSAPRRRGHSVEAYWIRSDLDGDGRIRQIRIPTSSRLQRGRRQAAVSTRWAIKMEYTAFLNMQKIPSKFCRYCHSS